MSDFIWFPIVAGIVTSAVMPIVRGALNRQGVVDVPNHRSAHSAPTPRGGGLACALGVLAGAIVAALEGLAVPWAGVIASLALAAVGYADDRLRLGATPRLAAQVVVGGILGYLLHGVVGAAMGVVVVPVIVNVVNFMDGINGITGLTMIVWGSAVVLAASRAGALPIIVLGALAAAAAIGFLPWNAPRSRVFLGDVGSYLFGGLAASSLLIGNFRTSVPPLILSVPLFIYLADVGVTLCRRALRKAPLLEAHREHIYQRLVHEAGLSHMQVATAAAVASALLVAAWGFAHTWAAATITSVTVCLYFASVPLVTWARRSALWGAESEVPK